ncbi:MAG: S8 family serine peptidase [Bacteroidales bacterium]|nr:S8 family serine peptidase [Bacteroidales bacterium]
MNTIKFVIFSLSTLLLFGCGDAINYPNNSQEKTCSGTKGMTPSSYYYWYRGKKNELLLNRMYVNVVVDTTLVKKASLKLLCEELGLEGEVTSNQGNLFRVKIKEPPVSIAAYKQIIKKLLQDARIQKVLPYFERGESVEPIGTSQFFYVQLKDLSPEGTPYLMKNYDQEALSEEAERLGVRVVKQVDCMPDWFRLSIEDSEYETAIDAANRFYETGRFREIDPGFMFSFKSTTVNDPLLSQQWGLKNTANPGYDINVEGAWSITSGSGVKIAIVDQGIDFSHGDIAANKYYLSYDAKSGTSPSIFTVGKSHGTHVAGIVGAVGNNSLQIAGVAYGGSIMGISHPLQVNGTISEELASGISWAWQHNVDILNNSWGDQGGQCYNNLHSVLLESSLQNALTNGRNGRGCVVVFAAGNYGASGAVMDYPATFDDRILAVGSIGVTGYRSSFSGYGSKLDIVAPGENILSTLPGNQTGTMSGTSMAAPHVAGVAALMLAANPQLTREEVVRIIQRTARKISPGSPYTYQYYPRDYMFDDETWNQEVGHGLVDATAAVMMGQSLARTPSLNDTGMDVTVSYSPTGNQHYSTVSGGSFPKSVNVSLLPAQVNASYIYFWRISTSSYPNWSPTLTFCHQNVANITVPAPTTTTTLYIQCFIYNGSTLVDVPSYALTVSP